MRQAVHIFLKDTRQLRWPILILLLWTAIFAVAGARELPEYRRLSPDGAEAFAYLVPYLSGFLFPIGWAYLVSQAFHADAIPGDRQFWLTRPYSRRSLFAAKALFVLAYVTLPLTLAQAAIVAAHGLPLGALLPGLLWEQVLITAVVVLPVSAIASLTSTLVQFAVIGLLAPLLFVGSGMLTPWRGIEWIRTGMGVAAVVVVASVVLVLQFSHRRTAASRLIALGGILATIVMILLLPWRSAFALQSRVAGPWNGTLSATLVTPAPKTAEQLARPGDRFARFRSTLLLFHVAGPSIGTPIVCEASDVTIEGADGQAWGTGLDRAANFRYRYVPVSSVPDGCHVSVQIPVAFSDAVADRPVRIRGILYITVFGAEETTDVPARRLGGESPATLVRDVHQCAGTKYDSPPPAPRGDGVVYVNCKSAFRAAPLVLRSAVPPTGLPTLFSRRGLNYSPFPADLRFQPVEGGTQNFPRGDVVTLRTVEPVAHERVLVDVSGIYLKDFEL